MKAATMEMIAVKKSKREHVLGTIDNKMNLNRKFADAWMKYNGGKQYNHEDRIKILEIAGLDSDFNVLPEVVVKFHLDAEKHHKLQELADKANLTLENFVSKIMNDFLMS